MLDRKGEPLQGLTRTDFTVLEDGKPQQIREFQSVELPAFAPAPAAPRAGAAASARFTPVSMNSMTAGRIAGRAFVLVYDDVNLTRKQSAGGTPRDWQVPRHGRANEDAVSLVTTSGGGLFHARTADDRRRLLALLDGVEGKFIEDTSAERMSDYEALRIHINQDTLVAARVRRRYEDYRVARHAADHHAQRAGRHAADPARPAAMSASSSRTSRAARRPSTPTPWAATASRWACSSARSTPCGPRVGASP